MNYIDAAFAPLRKTGQIKLYGPEAFGGMRKAGRQRGSIRLPAHLFPSAGPERPTRTALTMTR